MQPGGKWGAVVALVGLACATAPPTPAPGKGVLFGRLELVARAPTRPPAGYDDPRLAAARRVDYSRPGFSVVYAPGRAATDPAPVTLRVRSGPAGLRMHPAQAATSEGSRLRIANGTDRSLLVSSPSLSLFREIAAQEALDVGPMPGGEHRIYVGGGEAEVLLFAAPGSFVVPSVDGRWQLRDLEPGAARVRAWHSRLPPAEKSVTVVEGQATRVDLQVGVGLPRGSRESR